MMPQAEFGQGPITGFVNQDQANYMYDRQFGSMVEGTVYLDGVGTDRRPQIAERVKSFVEERIKSALTTQSPLLATGTYYSTTSGSIPVLLPTIVDPVLYDKMRIEYPLASGVIPRVTQKGLYVDVIRNTALPSPIWGAEMSAVQPDTATYDRVPSQVKFMYCAGQISGPMMVVAPQMWKDMLGKEIERHLLAMKELEENTIINGDTTSSTYTNGFNGLVAGITTNYSDKGTAQLELDDIDTAYYTTRDKRGAPDVGVTDFKTFNRLRALLKDYFILQGAEKDTIVMNLHSKITYMGITFFPDHKCPTASNEREMLILTVNKASAGGPNIQMRVLQEPTIEDLAKDRDAYSFLMKAYLTMVIIFEDWCYRLYDLP
ncbi:MAG: DUF5309 domain-containing protein [Gammaproteobacteria bacterium]|nr:DUF5309 domain-containing protein [Gammaproteobacteria bacterium]